MSSQQYKNIGKKDIIRVVNTICDEVNSQKSSKSSFSVGFAGDYEKDSV